MTDLRNILQYDLTKICLLAVRLFHADGQTDGQTDAFFFETSEKVILIY